MIRSVLSDTIKQIVNDIEFSELINNEERIQYIIDYIGINQLKESFKERTDIVRNEKKSFLNAMLCYMSASDKFKRITQGVGEVQEDDEEEVTFEAILIDIENAIINAPQIYYTFKLNIIFHAFVLKFRVHLILNSTENIINDYIQLLSVIDEMDSSEQFGVELDDIEDSIPFNTRKAINEMFIKKNVKQKEEMAKLRIDYRCVFVTHPEWGRYLVAEKDIEVNTILMQERPQVFKLDLDHLSKYCSYCYVELRYGFYPCFNCIECRFCDKMCAQKACYGPHRYECSIVGHIMSPQLSVSWLLGYRVLTSLGTDNINELYNTFLIDGQGFDLKQWILKYDNEVVLKNSNEMLHQYKGLSTFVEHSHKNTTQQKIFYIFDAIEIALLIEEINVFKDLENGQNFIRLVLMLIKHHNRCKPNGFAWSDGLYLALVSTMINHSCVPNSIWAFVDGRHQIKSRLEIKAGDEISISYGKLAILGLHYDPFIERQIRLRNVYNFVCDCVGCKRDKSTVISIMKCRVCKGTVYYGDINPNRVCVDCMRSEETNYYDFRYQNFIQPIINDFSLLIERDISEESINDCEELLEQMSELCESSSPDFLQMRQKLDSIYALFRLPFGQYSDTEMTKFYE